MLLNETVAEQYPAMTSSEPHHDPAIRIMTKTQKKSSTPQSNQLDCNVLDVNVNVKIDNRAARGIW